MIGWREWTGISLQALDAMPWHPGLVCRLRHPFAWEGQGYLLDLLPPDFTLLAPIGRDLHRTFFGGWAGRHGALYAVLLLVHRFGYGPTRGLLTVGGASALLGMAPLLGPGVHVPAVTVPSYGGRSP